MSEEAGDPIAFWDEQPTSLQAAKDRARAAVVVHLVALATGAAPREILRSTRARSEAARARWLAIYLTHIGFSIPLMRVASAFGRDRTSVSHVIHKVEDWRDDPRFDEALSQLERCLLHVPGEVGSMALAGRA